VTSGGVLDEAELRLAAASPDILALGMLADAARRAMRGRAVTYLRVATLDLEAVADGAALAAAGEVRMGGAYPGRAAAAAQVVRARAVVPAGRSLVAWSLADIEAAAEGPLAEVVRGLRAAGLDGVADVPVDRMASSAAAVAALTEAGQTSIRLTVEKASGEARLDLLAAMRAAAAAGPVTAVHPLPLTLNPFRPTTGYDDVRTVALARLALPAPVAIQVDWPRYGPKLAQVALTFGADDLYGAPAIDEAPDGPRRAALLEIRRNIEAAGFEPVERGASFAQQASPAV
jgi:aminodeoxyfutalosine synthase